MKGPEYGAIADQEAGGLESTTPYSVSTTPDNTHTAPRRRLSVVGVCALVVLGAAGVVLYKSKQEPVSEEMELWDKLSDADELLRYVVSTAYTGYDANTMDDDNFWPLSCAEYDDDTVYPNALCLSGDNATCHDSSVMTEHYVETCNTACGEGWGVPCGWQAIAQLPELCDGTFEATFPAGSNNLDPKMDDEVLLYNAVTINSTKETYWACNVHAFCYACVDDDNIVNDYCKAVVIRTKSLYGASAAFKYMDSYWCEDEIIDDIQNGTFCGYTADKMYSCEEKNSHA